MRYKLTFKIFLSVKITHSPCHFDYSKKLVSYYKNIHPKVVLKAIIFYCKNRVISNEIVLLARKISTVRMQIYSYKKKILSRTWLRGIIANMITPRECKSDLKNALVKLEVMIFSKIDFFTYWNGVLLFTIKTSKQRW